jgi:hypothetical protein
MRTSPALAGARSVKENVPISFGPTTDSTVVAGRSADSQPTFMPRLANVRSSPVIARFTWRPATPRCHVSVPVLRKRSE